MGLAWPWKRRVRNAACLRREELSSDSASGPVELRAPLLKEQEGGLGGPWGQVLETLSGDPSRVLVCTSSGEGPVCYTIQGRSR